MSQAILMSPTVYTYINDKEVKCRQVDVNELQVVACLPVIFKCAILGSVTPLQLITESRHKSEKGIYQGKDDILERLFTLTCQMDASL